MKIRSRTRTYSFISIALLASFFLSSPVHAAEGSMKASPKTCELKPSSRYCSSLITWSSSGLANVCVWRVHPTAGPAKWSCGDSGFLREYPWVDEDGRVLELRSNSSSYSESTLIDSVHLSAAKSADGSLSAASNHCNLSPGESNCSILLSWSTTYADEVCVWRKSNNLTPSVWRCSSAGSDNYPWVDEDGRILELRSNSSSYSESTLIDSVHLSAAKSADGSLSAASNHCNLSPGESNCSILLSWSTTYADEVCVWRKPNDLTPSVWRCSSAGSDNYPGVDIEGKTLELRYGSNSSYSNSHLIDSVTLNALPATPAPNPKCEKVSNRSGEEWYECGNTRVTQKTKTFFKPRSEIIDFNVYGDYVVWTYYDHNGASWNLAETTREYWSNTKDGGNMVQLSQTAHAGYQRAEYLTDLQIKGNKAIWRFKDGEVNCGLACNWDVAYYYQCLSGSGIYSTITDVAKSNMSRKEYIKNFSVTNSGLQASWLYQTPYGSYNGSATLSICY